jgi:hypothetical protein
MARWVDGFNSGKTPVINSTLTFSQNDLPFPVPGKSIVAIHFDLSGSGNTTSNLTRIRLRANGLTYVDVTYTELRAYFAGSAWSSLDWGASATRFTIPLHILDFFDEDSADQSAAPLFHNLQVDLAYGGTAMTTPLTFIGWTLSDVMPVFAPTIIGRPHNYGASFTNAKLNLAEGGFLRTLLLPNQANGYTRWRFVVNSEQRLAGRPGILEGANDYRDAGPVATSFLTHKFVGMPTVPPGGSYIEFDSGSGGAATDEIVAHVLTPQPAVAAASK